MIPSRLMDRLTALRTGVSEYIATTAVRGVYLEVSGLSLGPVDDGELAVGEHGLERVTLPVLVGDMSLQHPLVAQILRQTRFYIYQGVCKSRYSGTSTIRTNCEWGWFELKKHWFVRITKTSVLYTNYKIKMNDNVFFRITNTYHYELVVYSMKYFFLLSSDYKVSDYQALLYNEKEVSRRNDFIVGNR